MFKQKKTVDQIVKQFTTMADDLDVIMNEEADNMMNLQTELREVEEKINTSVETQTRASKFKSNILSLVQ